MTPRRFAVVPEGTGRYRLEMLVDLAAPGAPTALTLALGLTLEEVEAVREAATQAIAQARGGRMIQGGGADNA